MDYAIKNLQTKEILAGVVRVDTEVNIIKELRFESRLLAQSIANTMNLDNEYPAQPWQVREV